MKKIIICIGFISLLSGCLAMFPVHNDGHDNNNATTGDVSLGSGHQHASNAANVEQADSKISNSSSKAGGGGTNAPMNAGGGGTDAPNYQ